MQQLLYDSAVDFEYEFQMKQQTDLEAAARLSAPARQILENHLDLFFDAFMMLPYFATKSLHALLDCLSNHPGNVKNWHQAMQLKMGLFFCNTYGRMAWFRLHSCVLYTFELIVKFRKPSLPDHNLYFLDYPSFQRGPVDR